MQDFYTLVGVGQVEEVGFHQVSLDKEVGGKVFCLVKGYELH